MSYQVLARKWRPQFFKDLVGQEHVMRALINALDNQRLHHAYLFTGTRGVGKTTIARILAKCLNCEQGISSEPCGTCQSCQEISQGRFVDLIEVDAASRTKVEDTREILDNVQYAPTRGRYKVYLIDEVHMLSNSSFNALLKTLEEPPPHVKFLLATTDPQKLPATILSRCLQFSLKNMTPERIVGYLQNVLAQESVEFEEPGLWLLGRAAEGSMRDALSLTDQAISFGQGVIKEQDVAAMLGTVDRGRVFQLAIALAENDAAQALALVAQMAEHAVDFNNLLADLINLIHRIALAQAVPEAVDNSQGDKEQVMTLAGAMSPAMVQLMYQIALTGKRDLPLAPEPRAGLEMTLLRMLNFAPVGQQAEAQAAQSQGAAGGPAPVKKPDLAQLKRQVQQPNPATSISTPPEKSQPQVDEIQDIVETPANQEISVTPSQQPEASQAEISAEHVVVDDNAPPWDDDEPEAQAHAKTAPVAVTEPTGSAAEPIIDSAETGQPEHPQATQPASEPVARVTTEPEPTQSASDEFADLPLTEQTWAMVFHRLPLEGMLKNLAANTCLMTVQGDDLVFHSDAAHMRLFNDNHKNALNQALNQVFAAQYRVQVIEGPMHHETPAQRTQRLQAEKLQAARDSIENDENVQALRQAFNAQVIMDSITPLAD
ncbi:DNA polymerase III subunit gamma/tau [Bermanella marisrubri]|uniref:DNA polymerase III subunit gamma/tau n=1 Tax=Bermanella marisrubri TaxID=207949 RepID=Q1N199_9GAMM|nr:DNA polymerase III subunit gamma/tau [Bermanella marisrubri]EAT11952.1 DNA polymerase III subunits gamma and tau [Oceanobacter sp. RED65] [Bermanella marisrubri]QIZ84756.1 DNA polymerase III subunit gamma/tau [Bermanella marisrubri]